MVGLILLLPMIFSWLPIQQQTDDLIAIHLQRVENLLATTGEGWYFENTLFQSITRLEHGHTEIVHDAWQRLNQSPNDRSISDLILFSRRNQLPLPPTAFIEENHSALERALALWGDSKTDESLAAMRLAQLSYPTDSRFENNISWITMSPPKVLDSQSSSRELCQAILAFKSPQH
ncbi:MAG: hypothetical protein QGF46_01475 [Planctomycetota bacterium]|jgi:hypothetical protein|nr:hypothetical protein [Planctomycetota bacterium]